jgi:hypothetical protein
MIAGAPQVPDFTNYPGEIFAPAISFKGAEHEQNVTQKFFECNWSCCGLCRQLTPQG